MSDSTAKTRNRRAAWMILLVCLLIGSIAVYKVLTGRHQPAMMFASSQHADINGSILRKPQFIPGFELIQGNGKPFTRRQLNSRWTLLFFGFADCPYVCPTTLAELNKTMTSLSEQLPKHLLPHVVMVSVDPKRDTPKRMKSYVESFNKSFVGVTGSMQKILDLSRSLHISFAKIESGDGNQNHYTVTHTATIMVVGPAGRIRAYLSYPHHAQEMTKDYLTLMHVFHQVS